MTSNRPAGLWRRDSEFGRRDKDTLAVEPWTFEQIRRVTLSRRLNRGELEFRGRICIDSRQVMEGDLFIAIRGRRHDSHRFIRQVVAGGAAGLLVDRPLDPDVTRLVTRSSVTLLHADDTIGAMNRLAAAYRRDIRAKVIAVGGSNGKTTTKQIIYTLLARRFAGIASPKSFNNNIGLPLAILSVQARYEYVVLEVGTSAPGEIAALGHVAMPDMAVLTGIGLEHMEFLGGLPEIAREEAALARFIRPGGILILTNLSPELLAALRLLRTPRLTVGPAGTGADLEATSIIENMDGCRFVINGRTSYHLPLLGRHNVFNALLAIAVARRMGLREEEIAAGLLTVKPSPMRLEIQQVQRHFVLNDAYNANPASMCAALETFAGIYPPAAVGRSVRRVAILGDMLELGGQSDFLHRQVGRQVAAHRIDFFIAIGPSMKCAADEAAAAGVPVHHFPDTPTAAERIAPLLLPFDAILLKASRGMRLESILDALRGGEESSRPAGAVVGTQEPRNIFGLERIV